MQITIVALSSQALKRCEEFGRTILICILAVAVGFGSSCARAQVAPSEIQLNVGITPYIWAECIYLSPDGNLWGCAEDDRPMVFIESGARVVSKSVTVTSIVQLSAFAQAPEVGIKAFAIPVTMSTDTPGVMWAVNPVTTAGIFQWAHATARRTISKADSGPPMSKVVTSPAASFYEYGNMYIRWLPAVYKSRFQLTCYVLSVETEAMFQNSDIVSGVRGLPNNISYRSSFLRDVRMQGSGQTADGTIIHYEPNGSYSIQSCPRTASGQCAIDGDAIAVDPSVIPLRSTVDFRLAGARTGLGYRRALDTGGAIVGNHIDIYYGTRRRECRNWGSNQIGELKLHRF